MKRRRETLREQLLLALEPALAVRALEPAQPAASDSALAYRLRRGRRRTIGFQVDHDGLTVRAPRWVTLRQIEAAIAEHEHWIRRKELEYRARPRTSAHCIADGGTLLYLGQVLSLRLDADAAETALAADGAQLRVALPAQATSLQLRSALQAWLRAQALAIFAVRIGRLALNVEAFGWRLSSARTQWGSCSHDGRIRLNWRLVHFALPVIDYVIAHELAHLREHNHGPRFWNEVARLLPGYEAARDQIKRVEIDTIAF